MTDVEAVRERLAKMRSLCEAATPGPWVDDWWYGNDVHPESYAVRAAPEYTVARTSRLDKGSTDAAFLAAVSPDKVLGWVIHAEGVLNRHFVDVGELCACAYRWPCPDARAVLQAWA